MLQLFVVLHAVVVTHERHTGHVHEGHDPGAYSPELHDAPGRGHGAAELGVNFLCGAGGRGMGTLQYQAYCQYSQYLASIGTPDYNQVPQGLEY